MTQQHKRRNRIWIDAASAALSLLFNDGSIFVDNVMKLQQRPEFGAGLT
jgi:hypothetical protein